MKRISWIGGAVLALLACTGCTDQQARMLVRPVRWNGQAMELWAGSSDLLLRTGRIDAHRRIKTPDGTEIDTWLITSRLYDQAADNRGSIFETRITRGTVVLLHPHTTGKTWFLRLGEGLAERGWDVVLLDLRGHGHSGGDFVTWGAREKHDVKAVVDDLLRNEAISDRIYVCGSSMGGGVAIQYAAIEPRCKGVVALSPPRDAMHAFRKTLWMLGESDFEAAVQRAAEMADFDPREASAVAAAGKLSCPVVLVHGAWDQLVPVSHSHDIFDALDGRKKLVRLKYAGHTLEVGRTKWVANQVAALAAMDGELPPQRIFTRFIGRPDHPLVHVERIELPWESRGEETVVASTSAGETVARHTGAVHAQAPRAASPAVPPLERPTRAPAPPAFARKPPAKRSTPVHAEVPHALGPARPPSERPGPAPAPPASARKPPAKPPTPVHAEIPRALSLLQPSR